MSRFRFVRGFLRTLVGLDDRSGGSWGIDRGVMHDIERARWRRAMRESGRRSAPLPDDIPPPPAYRPPLYPPHVYREMLARSGASLRPEAERGVAAHALGRNGNSEIPTV